MSGHTRRTRRVLWAAILAVGGMIGGTGTSAFADAPTTAPTAEPAATPDNSSARDTEPLTQQPILPLMPAAAGTARTPIMGLLDKAGLAGPLDDAHIRVYGHIEGSYTYNFNNPARDINAGRVFDVEHADPTLNQLDLNIERQVDLTKGQFDIGGRVEWMWGGDARFIHGNGLLDNHDNDPAADVNGGPDNQFEDRKSVV